MITAELATGNTSLPKDLESRPALVVHIPPHCIRHRYIESHIYLCPYLSTLSPCSYSDDIQVQDVFTTLYDLSFKLAIVTDAVVHVCCSLI